MKKILSLLLLPIFSFNFLYADIQFIDKTMSSRSLGENLNSLISGQFKIEWGDNVPINETWEDLDSNGYPDYIDIVANSLTYSLNKFKSIGFEFDESLSDIAIIIANTNAKYNGTTQYLPAERYGGAYYYADNKFYFILNSTMPTILGQLSQQKNIEVTIAHELMHVLQYYIINKYDYYHNGNDNWFYEASAVFSEEICYPEHNYHTRYIKELYENLSEGIFSNIGYAPYRGVYFLQFLEQKYSDFSLYNLWKNYAKLQDPIKAINTFITSKKTTLNKLLKEFYDSIFEVNKYYIDNAEIYKNFIINNSLDEDISVNTGGCIKNDDLLIDFNRDDNYLIYDLNLSKCSIFLGEENLSNRDDLKNINYTSVDLIQGWNLIASPINSNIDSLLLFKNNKIFGYYNDNWIEEPKILIPKFGYWVYSNIKKRIYFSGNSYNIDNLNISDSWKLLGTGNKMKLNNFNIWVFRDNKWFNNINYLNRGEGFWIKK